MCPLTSAAALRFANLHSSTVTIQSQFLAQVVFTRLSPQSDKETDWTGEEKTKKKDSSWITTPHSLYTLKVHPLSVVFVLDHTQTHAPEEKRLNGKGYNTGKEVYQDSQRTLLDNILNAPRTRRDSLLVLKGPARTRPHLRAP